MASRELKRRELLVTGGRGLVLSLFAALALSRSEDRFVRPPGFDPDVFFSRCTGCLRCVQVCPTSGLRLGDLVDGLDTLKKPILEGYCRHWMTECLLCIEACPTGALIPMAEEDIKLGIAVIDETTCIPYASESSCCVCFEFCPVVGAITCEGEPVGRPVVDPDPCVGCKLCEMVCPVSPPAIRVSP